MEFIHKFKPGTLPVTVLLLHGSGGDENDLLPVGGGLVPGAALLSPRGNVVEHGATRFFGYPGPGGFDAAEIDKRVADFSEWLDGAIARYGIDRTKLYALGYSNGANMAAATMLLRPGTLAGACLLRSRAAAIPGALPQLTGAPVLISAGQHDEIIPASDTKRLAEVLSKSGAMVDFVVQNAGHELTPADFSIAKQWFQRLLQ